MLPSKKVPCCLRLVYRVFLHMQWVCPSPPQKCEAYHHTILRLHTVASSRLNRYTPERATWDPWGDSFRKGSFLFSNLFIYWGRCPIFPWVASFSGRLFLIFLGTCCSVRLLFISVRVTACVSFNFLWWYSFFWYPLISSRFFVLPGGRLLT